MFLSANIQSKVRANTYEIFIKITLFFYILLKNADISAYITIVFLKFRQKHLLTAGVHTGRSMVRTPGRSLLSETFLSLFFAHHIKKGNISKTISPMLLENPVFRPPSLFRLFIYSCTPVPLTLSCPCSLRTAALIEGTLRHHLVFVIYSNLNLIIILSAFFALCIYKCVRIFCFQDCIL